MLCLRLLNGLLSRLVRFLLLRCLNIWILGFLLLWRNYVILLSSLLVICNARILKRLIQESLFSDWINVEIILNTTIMRFITEAAIDNISAFIVSRFFNRFEWVRLVRLWDFVILLDAIKYLLVSLLTSTHSHGPLVVIIPNL